ncbi:MAG TPA: hypothetical protein DCE23_06745 [Firmicutes bacterium]|nr:hypothetical protein [Bacillota bacterium]
MKKKIGLIFFLLIVSIILIVIILLLVRTFSKKTSRVENYKVKESISVESGDKLPKVSSYFDGDYPKDVKIKYFYRGVEVTDRKDYFYYEEHHSYYTMGVFELEVDIVGDVTYSSKLIISDSKEPSVKFKDLTVKSYTKYDAKDFIDEYSDNSHLEEYTATFVDGVYEEIGDYEIKLKVCDMQENCITENAKLKIIPGDITIGDYKLDYGKYTGEICDENADIKHCEKSVIYILGDKIKLNDGTLKKYIVDKRNLILSNGESFRVIGDNEIEYQNSLKPIYRFVEEA